MRINIINHSDYSTLMYYLVGGFKYEKLMMIPADVCFFSTTTQLWLYMVDISDKFNTCYPILSNIEDIVKHSNVKLYYSVLSLVATTFLILFYRFYTSLKLVDVILGQLGYHMLTGQVTRI